MMLSVTLTLIIICYVYIKRHFIIKIKKSILNVFITKSIESLKTAEWYNSTEEKQKWWNSLDEQWRMIFRFQVYPNIDCNGLDIANYVLNAKQLDINLKSISNLNGLKHLSNLTDLRLNNYNSTDLSDLKRLARLTKLEITNSNFSNRVPIGAIKNIINLKLENCQIKDLSDFKKLKKLKKLDLKNNCIKDISCTKFINHLEFLSLQNNPIIDFSDLKYLPNTTIELSYNQKFNLKQLQEKNIQVIITFNSNYYQHDETFFQNN